ncbi:MAG TPA: hypothetical protein VFG33_40365 [Kribbella sp.]|uniref:hypothetical protein n=1 Tax=Kribbella sp. TaxID=1871183 RepID=UPI002D76B907|nr:hypothetical protein [Kribbella sp.]HET6299688.1 hypothetical protein [Kribbella sp.]
MHDCLHQELLESAVTVIRYKLTAHLAYSAPTVLPWPARPFRPQSTKGCSALDAAWRPLDPYADGAYRSFESRPTEATFRRAFPGATGDRVLDLRDHFDPDGLFRRWV